MNKRIFAIVVLLVSVAYGQTINGIPNQNVSGLATAVSLTAYGAVCNGSTDDSAAFTAAEAASANISIPLGTGACLINPSGSTFTLNSTYWFQTGGTIGIATGKTVTMNSQPQAYATKIFTIAGTGSVVLNNTIYGYPEWFGATGNSGSYTDETPFNTLATAMSYGTIYLTKQNYYGCGFSITTNVGVSGLNENLGYFGTYINCNNSSSTIFSVSTSSANCGTANSGGNLLQGFGIKRTVSPTSTAIGFNLSDACWPQLRNTDSVDSISDYYLHGTSNAFIWNSQAWWTSLSGSGLTVYGVNVDSTSGVANNSVRLGPHFTLAGNQGTTATNYGLYMHGSSLQDLFTVDMECASSTWCVYINGSGSAASKDIRFESTTCDGAVDGCFYVANIASTTGQDAVSFLGGLATGYAFTTGYGKLVDCESSSNVSISGIQFYQEGTGTGAAGVYGNSCVGLNINGNTFTFNDGNDPIWFNSMTGSIIANNVINTTSVAVPDAINLVSSTNNTVSANNVAGYATVGIALDSASNNNKLLGNVFSSNVTTAFTDAGSGNNWGLIAKGTAALGTGAISSGACASAVTVSATGVVTTDSIATTFNADPTSTTGYTPSTGGMLTIIPYPTANNVNFKVCNNSSSSITPGAVTLNWSVNR